MKSIVESRSNPVSGEGYVKGSKKRLLVVFGLLAAVVVALVGDPSISSAQKASTGAGVITAQGWGVNGSGQLGDGTTKQIVKKPVQVSNLSGLKAVAGGCYHSLALKKNGTVWAWGDNGYGQLGTGDNTSSKIPVQVQGPKGSSGPLTGVKAIAAGCGHSLALKNDGTVWAWGANFNGQLGDGSTTHKKRPVQLSNLAGIETIAAAPYYTIYGDYSHSLALKNDGTVFTWGNNLGGQLGDGSTTHRQTPVQVIDPGDPTTFLTNIEAISGGQLHSLALKTDGTVRAWGGNGDGQLGNRTNNLSTTPVQVQDSSDPNIPLTNIKAIAAGSAHSLALTTDGKVWAWGENEFNELGIGTSDTDERNYPVQVLDKNGVCCLTDVKAIAGAQHSLALKTDGTVWAWGHNAFGQLGNGSNVFRSGTPVKTKLAHPNQSGVSATAIATGELHNLAVTVEVP